MPLIIGYVEIDELIDETIFHLDRIRLTSPMPNKTSSDHRHRCEFFLKINIILFSFLRSGHTDSEGLVLSNETFSFNGPRCWTQFRLNRSEVFRCLSE